MAPVDGWGGVPSSVSRRQAAVGPCKAVRVRCAWGSGGLAGRLWGGMCFEGGVDGPRWMNGGAQARERAVRPVSAAEGQARCGPEIEGKPVRRTL